MGAVQAQEITAAKWAVGLRMKNPRLSAVVSALKTGKIIRIHILRPTWHYVAAKDVRWMSQISGPRIKAAWTSFARGHGIVLDESFFAQAHKILEKVLPGKSLDRVDLADYFTRNGLAVTDHILRYVLCCAEADGLVGSGPARRRTHTYMLMKERVRNAPACPREEALFRLARLYFQSHSPASLEDFSWWSGLPISEARRAVLSLGAELAREFFGGMKILCALAECRVAFSLFITADSRLQPSGMTTYYTTPQLRRPSSLSVFPIKTPACAGVKWW